MLMLNTLRNPIRIKSMKTIKKMLILFLMAMPFSLMAMEEKIMNTPPEEPIRLVIMAMTDENKSAFLNSIHNFITGRNIENDTNKQLSMGTQEPREYVWTGGNFNLSLIDCPKMVDPRGIDQDFLNTKKIARFLTDIGRFNAICIILQSSLHPQRVESWYFIEHIKSILPKSACERIFICVSHPTTEIENIESLISSTGLSTKNIFYFDNFALSKDSYLNEEEIDNNDMQKMTKVKTWISSKEEFNKLILKAKDLGKYSSDEMKVIVEIKKSLTEKMDSMKQLILRFKAIRKNYKNTIIDNETHNTLDRLSAERKELQEQIIILFLHLGKISLSSINFHIGEYYDLCIRREEDSNKRKKLLEDQKFYIKQIELYKQRKEIHEY